MSRAVAVRFWLITLVAAMSVLLTASLGLWQLGRAQQKRTLEDLITARAALPEWHNQALLDTPQRDDHLHRPVRLNGRWVQGATLFLDNRPMAGRTGFIVLTPLRLAGSERAVLVQRGWVPRDFQDRQRLPEVPTPAGDIELQGRLALPPSQLFELGAGAQGAIRQNVDLSALGREWSIPLLEGVSIQQTGPAETPLIREWPRFAGDEHKHLAYAAQWFAMCAGVALLYLWFQILQPRLKRRPHGQAPR